MSEYVHLCLTDLLDRDMSRQEYFNALPDAARRALLEMDEIRTFAELQESAARFRDMHPDVY